MVRYVVAKLTPIAELPPTVPTAPASARVLDEQPAREHAARSVNAADRTNPRKTNRHRIVLPPSGGEPDCVPSEERTDESGIVVLLRGGWVAYLVPAAVAGSM